MRYICYEDKNFSDKSVETIARADTIIREYSAMGYVLTLRQLYYQFVSRAWIENTERSYKNLGNLINDARMAGLIPWDGIEDRAREFNGTYVQEDPQAALDSIEYHYALDLWSKQGVYIETWVEKEALGNVVERACSQFKVPHMACKGYLSASQAWRAGLRFKDHLESGDRCILLHLGDHDPSGIDMTRDNTDRLRLFAEDYGVTVKRLALNEDQISKYNPPPNPAKLTDSRAQDYIARFGESSWELDALRPEVIENIIKDNIRSEIDMDLWNDTLAEQRQTREKLVKLRENYDNVMQYLDTL